MGSLKFAALMALVALSAFLWLGATRKSAEQTAPATIVAKTLRPAHSYVQQPVGANRGLLAPTEIAIGDAYVFDLRVDGMAKPVRTTFNAVKSRRFEPGQQVRVTFVRRGVPLFGRRVSVVDMVPATAP